ncbi:amino acid adenylation domain-containing protein, partial [Rhodococcus marinonascens]|uniref:amino acid adenylation domain-containing protein n=1 Tax=Rhodococcus marinonascens TaxID=38311 RepID=UPI0035A2243D
MLDSRLQPTPVGTAGELYLAGVQLARGYHGRADLTADRFVASPFGEPGAQMYRTGDLVRWNRGGDLEFLGRTDFQVKVRGLRIELGEIESALAGQDTVAQAVVVVHESDLGQQLVGYVVPAAGHTVDTEAVREAAGQSLPAYMVPDVLIVLDELPLNSSGKLDRKALPAPEFTARVFRAPTNPVEEIVAGIFAEVLGVDRVGLDDDFFALGGNSLIATRVTARLGAVLDARVPVRELFEASTVEALAVRAEQHAGQGGRPALLAGPRPDRVPLSLAQQRMWFLNRFDPGSAAYNIPLAIRLTGELDVAAMQAAVVDVLARHEALRTVFPDSDQGPSQVIVPLSQVPVDLTPVPVADEDELRHRAAALLTRGFDVAAEVPLRGALFQLAADEFVLAMVVHHICADGFSTAPMARDIVVAYAARCAGHEPGWAPLPVQYPDYTLWQRELLGSEDDPGSVLSQQIGYWSGALAGVPDVLALPTDRPRPVVRSGVGGRVEFSVPAPTVARLQSWAHERGATPFMVVHAALSVVLAKLSGTTDIAVGSAIAGRGEAALDDLVGMFVNTLVLRAECDPDLSFAELVDRVRHTDLEAFAHADVPFERLVEELNPTRSQSFSPLFQVMLLFQNYTQTGVELAGLTIAPLEVDWTASQTDLSMSLSDVVGGGYAGTLAYAADIFDAVTAAQIAERFVRVLEVVLEDPSVPVGEVSVLDDSERALVLDTWNDTDHQVPEVLLLDGFDAQVARTPDAVALVFEGQSLTYAQFDARVNRLARFLIDAGVGPESLVAVGMRRSLDLLVGIYAVLRAGGAYVPIDPDHPVERTEYVLDTAAPVCVLSTSRDGVAVSGHRVVDVDVVDVSGYSSDAVVESELRTPVRPENAAYVIFTSGSTGRPKGVAVSHRAVVNFLLWMASECDFTDSDVVVQKAPVTFDASVWELFLPLAVGARLVIARPDGQHDPEYLVSLMQDTGVTVVQFVPSMLGALLADPEVRIPASVRLVQVGGEALPADLVARFADRTDAVLGNMYGPTEAAVYATYYRCDDRDVSTVPIGVPEWNTHTFVLDSRLQPVPVGVPGELYLAGVQLARGYHGRTDLTADRFVANPFADTMAGEGAGSRLYRTGDLVRWNTLGQLEFLGRTDFQVKVRGLRIELGEIETALAGQDTVAQAVVVVHESDLGQQLVGYVVPAAGHTVDTEAVREAAGQSLPRYMVPDVLVVLEVLPLNSSGKLDRKALPAPEFTARVFRAPTNPVEETVAGIFADLLGIERVGLDDDFFALGGNSLIATRVIARLGAALDARVPVRELFEASTVEALAVRLERHAGQGGRPVLVAGVRPERVPLSLAQQRMWFLNQFDPGSAAYNIPLAIRLTGELDVAAMQAAVADVLGRHEALRTVFPDSEQGPSQVIVPLSQVPVDLTPVQVAGEDELRHRAAALLTRGFDVAAEVPVRGALFRVSESEHVLAMVVHHICADGFSTAPLSRDVVVAYAARCAGHEPGWAPLPVQYADYTLWQRELLGSEDDPGSVLSQQIGYWSGALAGVPDVLALPTDRPRPVVRSGVGGRVEFAVPAATVARLQSWAHERGATPFMVVHAALSVVLAKLSGTTDIAVGSPIAGRGEAALDDLVGMFVNTLVLRAECDPNLSFTELVDRVRETDLEAFAAADVPFERLVEKLNPTRS